MSKTSPKINDLKSESSFESIKKTQIKANTLLLENSEQQSENDFSIFKTVISAGEERLLNRLDKVEIMLEKLLLSQSQVSSMNTAVMRDSTPRKQIDDTGMSIISSLGDMSLEENKSRRRINEADSHGILIREIDRLKEEIGKLKSNDVNLSNFQNNERKKSRKLPFLIKQKTFKRKNKK